MQYTAFLLRSHLTKTRLELIDDKSYDLPVHENTTVTVHFDRV